MRSVRTEEVQEDVHIDAPNSVGPLVQSRLRYDSRHQGPGCQYWMVVSSRVGEKDEKRGLAVDGEGSRAHITSTVHGQVYLQCESDDMPIQRRWCKVSKMTDPWTELRELAGRCQKRSERVYWVSKKRVRTLSNVGYSGIKAILNSQRLV